MPKIKDVKANISDILDKFKTTEGVKSLYLWGSYAKNISNQNFRVRDIDVLAKTAFNSGDLLSIDKKIIDSTYANEYLEDQGYDPIAVKFSKNFTELLKCNVDCWAISNDRKLLHWGPILINALDSNNVNKEAEKYASSFVGMNRKRINRSSEQYRKNWFEHYVKYVNKCFEGMPTGWYKTEDIKVRDITSQAIKI